MIDLQKIADTFFDCTKRLFISVFDIDASFPLFTGRQTLCQTIQKRLIGKMNGEMVFRCGDRHISLIHLFPHQPHGHREGDLIGQLGKFRGPVDKNEIWGKKQCFRPTFLACIGTKG